MKTRTFCGFEIPQDMKMTKSAKLALRRYKNKGFAVIERDDGPNGYQTFNQLKTIADNIGIEYVHPEPYKLLMFNDSKPVPAF